MEIRRVSFCPHCCNKAPQKLIHVQDCSDTGWFTNTGEATDLEIRYFVAICETCSHILVYRDFADIEAPENFITTNLVFPNSHSLHDSIPTSVSSIYEEAIRIKNLAPNAFAVQIRRALEAICKDRGASKGTLVQNLKELAKKGEIPPTLAEVTDVLRFIGNLGAHAAEDSVKPWQGLRYRRVLQSYHGICICRSKQS